MIDLKKLEYLIIDVDGTLTDSGIYYDTLGNEFKKFTTRDYVGVLAAHYIGLKIVALTGRECKPVERRLKEIKVDEIYQNIKNKYSFLEQFMNERKLKSQSVIYIGDDLNDYAAMNLAGVKACPGDAAMEIKAMCDIISTLRGGEGVLQDVFRNLLSELGCWEDFMKDVVMKGY